MKFFSLNWFLAFAIMLACAHTVDVVAHGHFWIQLCSGVILGLMHQLMVQSDDGQATIY